MTQAIAGDQNYSAHSHKSSRLLVSKTQHHGWPLLSRNIIRVVKYNAVRQDVTSHRKAATEYTAALHISLVSVAHHFRREPVHMFYMLNFGRRGRYGETHVAEKAM